MADVLTQEEGAAQTPGTGAAGSTGEGATTETGGAADLSPEVQALIDTRTKEALEALRAEYEGKDGHIARAKSAKDKQIAALKKQLAEQSKGQLEEAKKLLATDPERAGQILIGLAEQQTEQITRDDAQAQLLSWQGKILEDLGADPAEDEDAAKLVEEWAQRLMENPDLTWDFQQAAAQLQLSRERKARQSTEKRLADLEGGMEDAISAAVTKALVGAGVIADPSPEGGKVPTGDFDRERPSVARGLAKRKANPVVKKA